jgi:alpha-glucosidase
LDLLSNFWGAVHSHCPWPTEVLVKTWQEHMASVPWQITCQQFTLLDSHDTGRIRTTVGGNDALHRLAAMIQFTFPGVPCIYYGDEIGMMDEPGFGSRNCMQWDKSQWNIPLWDFYRELIDFRKNSEILKDGSFRILHWEKDFFLYERELNGMQILVSANRSPIARPASPVKIRNGGIAEGTWFVSIFNEGHNALAKSRQLTLPELPQGAVIWVESELQPSA